MIPSVAINNYLEAPRDDHRWVKRLTHSELDSAFAALTPPPSLYPGLRLHQKACVLLGMAYPQFSFWCDLGSGKTLITLELLRYWWQAGKLRRALIFVISDKAFLTWEKQIARFNIGVPYITLEGSSPAKWRALDSFGDGLVILTYPGTVAMVSQSVKDPRSNKMKWVLDPKLVAALQDRVDAVVLDESTKAGHRSSLTHKLISKLCQSASVRYALAGRPFGRDPTMLWNQQYLIDEGESLGGTLGLFRAAFFHEETNRWDKHGRAKNYKFNKRLKDELSRLAQHRSITYTADECVDLPPVVPLAEDIRLPQEAGEYYKQVVKRVQAARGNLRAMKSAFLHMRQLSSGFLGFKDDFTGEKAEIAFDVNPKLDCLLELLEQLPEGRKAVVFYEYTYSGRKISQSLTDMGIDNIWLWSGTIDPRASLRRFETNKDCLVAVVNNRVGAYSLDGLQVANYSFFYESPLSAIDRDQAEHRIIRDGQRFTVFQYDLIVRGTADAKIRAFHKEGGDIFKAVLRDPALMFAGD